MLLIIDVTDFYNLSGMRFSAIFIPNEAYFMHVWRNTVSRIFSHTFIIHNLQNLQ
jgi:hypothetical protein